MDHPTPSSPPPKAWSRIIGATGSPLKLFALIVLVCCSVFAVAAGVLGHPDTFVYCIHMFLAIVGAFVLTALWSLRSLYHPKEPLEIRRLHREDDDREISPVARPWVPTIVIMIGAAEYAVYQYATRDNKTVSSDDGSIFEMLSRFF